MNRSALLSMTRLPVLPAVPAAAGLAVKSGSALAPGSPGVSPARGTSEQNHPAAPRRFPGGLRKGDQG
jgi:hypothetical protein